ncbi:MAG: hypothetical protein J5966_01090 [Lachnospiraceae bacterium]|nr:hypothetical protein [Lachnospiraceae bacterium]
MNSRTISLAELNERERELLSRNDVHAAMIDSRRLAKKSAEEYRAELQDGEWNRDHYKAMEAGVRLHRGDVMGFTNDKEFINHYDRYRLTLFRAVESYRTLEELREKDPERFRRSLESMRMTVTAFDKLSDKINVLDMQGRYMDVRARIVTNPYYISLEEGRFEKLKAMDAEDLQKEIGKIPGGADAENQKSFLEAVLILKKMEGYGITPKQGSTKRKTSSYDKAPKKKNGVYMSFNTLSHDEGIPKKPKKKKSFWDYIKGRKWKTESSDSSSRYGKIGGETVELLGVKTNIANGKYRVAKIGGKYTSKNNAFMVGAHLTGGTVKGSAEAGACFSGGKLWNNKIYAAASATAYGLRGVGKVSAGYRKDLAKVDAKTEANLGFASAKGQAGVGMVRYVDGTGKTNEGFGVNAGITSRAAVLEGSVGGGITIFGVRFGGKVMGNALSTGFSTKVTANTKGIAFGISLSLGLGAGFEFSIDWSGLKEKFAAWRKRRKQKKKLRELREQEKSHKPIEAGYM